MKIGFLNASYSRTSTGGGSAHVRQFVDLACELGHQIWSYGAIERAGCHSYSPKRIQRLAELRATDCFYHRIEGSIPNSIKWWEPKWKQWIAPAPQIWEWNTVPEFGLLSGKTTAQVDWEREKWRKLAKLCNLSICVSETMIDYLGELGFKNCLFVPNGSDPQRFGGNIPPGERIALFANSFNVIWIGSGELSWHDFETIRKVAVRFSQQVEVRVEFHVIGSGVRDLHDAPRNLHYHGQVSYQHLPNWLAGAQLGIIAYKDGPAMHGSPLKLFDYMASGLAVVSTAQPQVQEILAEVGLAQNVVPLGDSDGLAHLILQFAKNQQRALQEGQMLRELLIEKYTWEQNAKTILSAINDLIPSNRR